MAVIPFDARLETGQIGESTIAQWLRSRGWTVLPVYEIEISTGKGPRLFAPREQLIAPDMLCYKTERTLWIEAKHKSVFSWHGMSKQWVTGIDLHHYHHYLRVAESSPWDVWLLFLHRSGRTDPRDVLRWGCPEECPVGLFGNKIDNLHGNENHTSSRWGNSGMVYWSIKALKPLARIEAIRMLEYMHNKKQQPHAMNEAHHA